MPNQISIFYKAKFDIVFYHMYDFSVLHIL